MVPVIVPPKGCTSFKTRQFARLLARHHDVELAKAGLKENYLKPSTNQPGARATRGTEDGVSLPRSRLAGMNPA
jgi:hypothetical protein